MRIKSVLFIIASIAVLSLGCTKTEPAEVVNQNESTPPVSESSSEQTINFSQYNSIYKFSADIPSDWKVEYVASIESINIYDPALSGATPLDQSIIFIRNFSANDFLTLQTVNILNRESTKVGERAAVEYEIEKKAGVADFPSQPSWRNARHKLIDIRYSQTNPSPFYVFAHSPQLPGVEFDEFISGLVFQ